MTDATQQLSGFHVCSGVGVEPVKNKSTRKRDTMFARIVSKETCVKSQHNKADSIKVISDPIRLKEQDSVDTNRRTLENKNGTEQMPKGRAST